MYCIQCGVELPNEAKFCSNCGAKLDNNFEQIKSKNNKKVLKEEKRRYPIFDKFVTFPNDITNYVRIYLEFKEKAEWAITYVKDLIENEYKGLNNIVDDLDVDICDVDIELENLIFNELINSGVLGYSKDDISKHLYEVTRRFDLVLAEIIETNDRIEESVSNTKIYREAKKNSRGKLIGGGFGIGGAIKGIAMAGTFNMATGMLHSVSNSLSNGNTEYNARKQKEKIFYDRNIRESLYESIYYDVLNAHVVLIELLGLNGIKVSMYSEKMQEKAYNIYDALSNGNIKGEKIEQAICEMITLFPLESNFYELAAKSFPAEIDKINVISAVFKIDLTTNLNKQEENIKLAAECLCANSLYKKLSNCMTYSMDDNLSFISNFLELHYFKKIIILSNENKKKHSRDVEKFGNIFACFSKGERPLAIYGDCREGFVITNEKLYIQTKKIKIVNKISFYDFENCTIECGSDQSSENSIVFNESIRIHISNTEIERRNIHFQEIINFLVYLMFFINCNVDGRSELIKDDILRILNIDTTDLFIPSMENAWVNRNQNYDSIMRVVAGLYKNLPTELKKYCFTADALSEYTNFDFIRFKNAIDFYGDKYRINNEMPLLCFDDSASINSPAGFIVTNQSIIYFYYQLFQNPAEGRIPLKSIYSCVPVCNVVSPHIVINEEIKVRACNATTNIECVTDLIDKLISKITTIMGSDLETDSIVDTIKLSENVSKPVESGTFIQESELAKFFEVELSEKKELKNYICLLDEIKKPSLNDSKRVHCVLEKCRIDPMGDCEKPVLLYDDTLSKSGNEGFLVTSKRIYYYYVFEGVKTIELNLIESVTAVKKLISPYILINNNIKLGIAMAGNRNIDIMVDMIEKIIEIYRMGD
ncbi:zinc ribbon domain-containing protein [Anaerotignum propionicum]|uniref:Zinc-ribbon domain-containing protein n=1 Tax=Anaerotignum propionicum DSM 1682 TaxID=991789 RepID=A0A0X1U920_ANAPI|nr:zinc ribbon domain-containing protein [Anaerotignum propionicum]AMJ41445.1 hypothetical protein CPRO_18630 [Anaerotignum propionicum DSM 1682]SHE68617.1 zinc-ribbon domain-containing protein [[Clostridium] propionicum DSM 1682] [Anaerotignum propionicum DSM 1682]